jgi:hypothetical protein
MVEEVWDEYPGFSQLKLMKKLSNVNCMYACHEGLSKLSKC